LIDEIKNISYNTAITTNSLIISSKINNSLLGKKRKSNVKVDYHLFIEDENKSTKKNINSKGEIINLNKESNLI